MTSNIGIAHQIPSIETIDSHVVWECTLKAEGEKRFEAEERAKRLLGFAKRDRRRDEEGEVKDRPTEKPAEGGRHGLCTLGFDRGRADLRDDMLHVV